MRKHITFGKIGQFRNIIKDVIHSARFVGMGDDGEPRFDETISPPTIVFEGTVKLHGTNAAFCCNAVEGFWFQSRTRILTPDNDNAQCCLLNEPKWATFNHMAAELAFLHNVDVNKNTISIYFEWCGGNVQNGVAISGLDKMAVIIGAKVTPHDAEIPAYWVSCPTIKSPADKIYNIHDFPTYSLAIDFDKPELAQAEMIKLVEEVERECPVGKAFGREFGKDNTIGEGIVWTGKYKGQVYRFKTKGEKHSSSKVKTVAAVDLEMMESVDRFVKYALTENRLMQGIEQVFTANNQNVDVSGTGDYIRWVVNDVRSEEEDVIVASVLDRKMVNRAIGKEARKWFFKYLEENI